MPTSGPSSASDQPDHLAGTERLVARFVEQLAAREPDEASRIGATGHDHELPDLTPDAVDAWSRELSELGALANRELDALGGVDEVRAREARGDLRLLLDEVDQRRFWLEQRPRLRTDPLAVLDVVAGGMHELLRRVDGEGGDDARARLRAAGSRARAMPRLLEQAGLQLEAVSEPHRDVALQRIPGLVELVCDHLPARAETLGVDADAIAEAGRRGSEGLQAFAALLDELGGVPSAPWRLGPADHAVVLRAALGTELDADEIAGRARARIVELHAELDELAGGMWPSWVGHEPRPADASERIRRVLRAVADTAVDRDELVAEAQRAVAEAREFAHASGLADMPPARLLTVTEMPAYLQGVAVAFISEPPALDPDAGCTYYLSPIPEHWDDEQAGSFLREYNPAQLRSLAIHEGYPGHFVQLEHAAAHPRLARRLFGRPVFAEGWAVYIERESVRAGFGDDAYRLTQRKLELRIATNALLDIGLHAGDLDDEEALRMLTDDAFQETSEAEGKLVRAKVTSGQLCSYFVGGAELGDLRTETERREGARFDLRDFHQRVLAHGTPTVAILRDALGDPAPPSRPFA